MNISSFSSEVGKDLVCKFLQNLWPHTPRDYQLEAVTKALNCIDVLAILPTSTGKTAILTMFMLVLTHMKPHPDNYAWHSARFPDNPIMVVVYPTNCLEEEQVRMYIRNIFIERTKDHVLRLQCSKKQG